jgi:cytochrome c-type biogenesis protein CcmH/NrfG
VLAEPTFLNHVFDTFELQLLKDARPAEALALLERQIAASPEEAYPYVQAGRICEDLKRPRDALAFYERASRLNPGWSEEFAAGLVARIERVRATL